MTSWSRGLLIAVPLLLGVWLLMVQFKEVPLLDSSEALKTKLEDLSTRTDHLAAQMGKLIALHERNNFKEFGEPRVQSHEPLVQSGEPRVQSREATSGLSEQDRDTWQQALARGGRPLCKIGEEPWNRDWLLSELSDFRVAYDSRPVARSRQGSNLFHAFAQWSVVKMVKPTHIVESGAMLGWGTYMLRKAAGPSVHLIVVTPVCPNKKAMPGDKWYMDPGPATYVCGDKFVDFADVKWATIPGLEDMRARERVLVYFDDHQSEYRRLLEAQRVGFTHIMYDDGYPWPGDNFALKQACDAGGANLLVQQSMKEKPLSLPSAFEYTDNFRDLTFTIGLEDKKCIAEDLQSRLKVFHEFPPLWPITFRGKTSPLLHTMSAEPLMRSSDSIRRFLQTFKQKDFDANLEAAGYTFFVYVNLVRAGPTVPSSPCLAWAKLSSRYSLTNASITSRVSYH
mmetsp:Transcript_80451/g.172150  ORF Transcript_80451/g.172150 Transcript_80451/m.172150 type:complete len:453 (-) Transcript_80451:231-1589(-)